MKFKISAAVAALSLISAPVLAQSSTAPAAKIERVSAVSADASNLGGGSDGLIAALAVAMTAAFVFFIVDGDEDLPTSP